MQTSNNNKIKVNQSPSHGLGVLRAISLPNGTSTASQGQLQIGPPVTAGRPSLHSPFPSKSQNQKTHCIAVGLFSWGSHDLRGHARKHTVYCKLGIAYTAALLASMTKTFLPIEYDIGTHWHIERHEVNPQSSNA